MHGNIPMKWPLRPNLTPLVTITCLDLANMNSGCWTCLPQVAHTTLNPSIEMNVEMLSTLHLLKLATPTNILPVCPYFSNWASFELFAKPYDPHNPIQQTETLKLVNKLKGISVFVLWGTISVVELELMFVQKYWFWVLQDVYWTTWSYRQFTRKRNRYD